MAVSDENAFGVLLGYYALEDDEYGLTPLAFVERFREFRDAIRDVVKAFPLARALVVRELGHAVYLEFADGEQLEDPIAWIKTARARLGTRELANVAVLSHGGRWQAEPAESGAGAPSAPTLGGAAPNDIDGVTFVHVALPSEPLRRALYAETASHDASDDEKNGWGPGLYVDTEAIEALGRTLKNAPTPLAVAGATFYRLAR